MKAKVASVSLLKEKGKLRVKFGIHYVMLAYYNEKVYAIKDKCPHMGFPLSFGNFEDGVIRCKDHGLPISVVDGTVTDNEKAEFLKMDEYSRSVKTYKVSIVGDDIFIES